MPTEKRDCAPSTAELPRLPSCPRLPQEPLCDDLNALIGCHFDQRQSGDVANNIDPLDTRLEAAVDDGQDFLRWDRGKIAALLILLGLNLSRHGVPLTYCICAVSCFGVIYPRNKNTLRIPCPSDGWATTGWYHVYQYHSTWNCPGYLFYGDSPLIIGFISRPSF